MRFRLLGDWPGPRGNLIEGGTIIDGNDANWRGVPMPLNAVALDVEAANAMVSWHPFNQHRLHFASGVTPTLRINV